MPSVLIVSESPGATPQIRALQYEQLFRKSNRFDAIFVTRKPAWFGRTHARLQSRWWSVVGSRIMHRCEERVDRWHEDRILSRARQSHFVYLVRVPSWRLHKALWEQQRARIVMDLNDGLWLPYHRQSGYVHLEDMLRHSHAIVCENEALKEYACRYNPNVHIVPDCPQLEEFDAVREVHRPDRRCLTLGWIGGPVASDNLAMIFEPLEKLFRRHTNIHLRVLGADQSRLPRFEHVRFSCKPVYSSREMVEEALQMDIGLFPLFRTEDSITRGTLKPKIYMSAGAVAACQNWGGSRELIHDRVNGVLAGSNENWLEVLEWLILHPIERAAIAERGLATIRSRFSRQMCFEKLVAVFNAL